MATKYTKTEVELPKRRILHRHRAKVKVPVISEAICYYHIQVR